MIRSGCVAHRAVSVVVIGVVASIIIALVSALFSPLHQSDRYDARPADVKWSSAHSENGYPAGITVEWEGVGLLERRCFLNDGRKSLHWDLFEQEFLASEPDARIRWYLDIVRTKPTAFSAAQVRAGWPMHCLYGEQWLSPPLPRRYALGSPGYYAVIPHDGPSTPWGIWPTRYRWATGGTSRWSSHGEVARTIPLLPLPLGLAINTLFYASIFFVVVEGGRVIVRRRRIARSLCPRCKYPQRTGSERCSECGEPVIPLIRDRPHPSPLPEGERVRSQPGNL